MKKIYLSIVTLVLCVFMVGNVKAANASISVSSSSSRVIVGNYVTITAKVSSSSPLGSWEFDVASSGNLSFVDSSFGGLYVRDVVSSSKQYSKTYTFKFKATKSGTATISIKNSNVLGYDESKMTVSNGSISFQTLTQAELEASYSKNNNLSNLEIEGYDLNFSKEKLEYNLEVENDVQTINIKAIKEDSKASISGAGEVNLSEGINNIDIVVTAQNGSIKKYRLIVTRKELNPINVNVDSKNYTVIRKVDDLPESSIYFTKSNIIINGEEIASYHNEVAKIDLVGLKDESGNVKLFIYENDKYIEYNELRFNQLVINVLDDEINIPQGYKQTEITIGGKTYKAYVNDSYTFPLIYGMNLETGEKQLYTYDSKENTLQRYVQMENNEQLYLYTIIGLTSFVLISYIIIIPLIVKNLKGKKPKNFSKKEQEELLKTMKIDITEIKNSKKEEKLEKIKQKELIKEQKLTEKALKIKEKMDLKNKKKEEKSNKKKKDNNDDMAKL